MPRRGSVGSERKCIGTGMQNSRTFSEQKNGAVRLPRDQPRPNVSSFFVRRIRQHGSVSVRVSFCGWTLPVQYTASVIQSHLHTRAAASIFDVSHMLQILVTGADRVRFFERLVVSDLENLPENSACLTLYTNEQGGILDDLIVTKTSDGYLYVVSNAGRAQQDLAHLKTQLEKAKRDGLNVDIEVLDNQSLLALQVRAKGECGSRLTFCFAGSTISRGAAATSSIGGLVQDVLHADSID